MKVKFKLSILVIGITILIVAGIAALLLSRASAISLGQSLKSIKYLANYQAEYWKGREDSYFTMLRTLADIMADFEDVEPELRRNRFDAMLLGTITSNPNLVSVFTVWKPNAVDSMDSAFTGRPGSTPGGQYAVSYGRNDGSGGAVTAAKAVDDVSAVMTRMAGPSAAKDRLDDPVLKIIGGKEMYLLRFEVPVINSRTGEITGCVGCLLDIAVIQENLESVIRQFDEISIMAIYSKNGFILGHFLPGRVGQMLFDVDVEYGANRQAAFRAVQNGEDFRGSTYDPTLNLAVNLVMSPFRIGNSDQHWTVLIGSAEDYSLAPVRELTTFTLWLAITTIAAAAAILFFVLQSITKPIVNVTETLKDIAQGEGDLTHTIVIRSNDEVGDLARYFNQTLDKIKTLIVTIKTQAASLSDIGNKLAANMTETAASANQITATIQSIKGRILNQSASVTETNATMEQITMNIDNLSGQVEKQTSAVAQSSSAIEEMLANIQSVTETLVKNGQNVRELMDASDNGRTGLRDVASDIQEIARESEGLLEINAVMETISSQTNLLSMNAAIEAAHAGEAGKGFAVVADEIRKLAESSGEQSKTISAVLKKIKTSIDKITQSTDSVLKKFEAIDSGVRTVAEQAENIRGAMEEQGEGSKQIFEAIGQVNEITRQVKGGSQEMLEGSREVIHESRNLEKVTEEITGGMNEMAAGAEQINAAINQVSEISAENKTNIDLLMKEVARFKVE